jgi:serine protease inhibitor
MNTRWFAVAVLVACAGACGAPVTPPSPEPTPVPEQEEPGPTTPAEDIKALADGNNAFAIDLYKKLAEKEKGNIIFSPYSIRTALAMTYAGARGQTADEMQKVLHFTLPDERLHPAFAATMGQLQGGKGKQNQLNVANALWGQKGFPFRSEFIDLLRKNYANGFHVAEFGTEPDFARETINRWVEAKTNGKIPALLSEEDVHKHTQLVLVNAVHFRGAWAAPFPKENTTNGEFHVAPGKTVSARMMQESYRTRYFEERGVRFLVLPYRDTKCSFAILLPAEGNNLTGLEQHLTGAVISEWLIKASRRDVRVVLPQFRGEWRSNLMPVLRDLGLRAPFSPNADFSGVADAGRLLIDRVIHQATIEVAEEGTEASAATAISMPRPIAESTSKEIIFRADRPFLYAVVDETVNAVIFLGRVTAP